MTRSDAPRTSAHPSASERKIVLRAGTYVEGMSVAARSRSRGTSTSLVSADPPMPRRSSCISSRCATPSACAIARADSISRACRWPYAIVRAQSSNPSARTIAAAVYESSPPLSRTTALDATCRRMPDELVDLELQARRQMVGEHPFRERLGIEYAVHGRDEHRTRTMCEIVSRDHIARELVVGAILHHEFHLIVWRQSFDVRPVVLVGLAARRTLDVDNLDHRTRYTVDRSMPASFDHDRAAGREQPIHQRVDIFLQQ